MTRNFMHRLEGVVRSMSKKILAILAKVGGPRIKVGLLAAALFTLAYVVETKAIFSLESSQNLFEVIR
jgi:hypothetical protein